MGDEPGYFCSCIGAMAVSRAEFAAQSLELQAALTERDEYKALYEAGCISWGPAYEFILNTRDEAQKELHAVREALERAEAVRSDEAFSGALADELAKSRREAMAKELQAVREERDRLLDRLNEPCKGCGQ